MKKIVLPFIFIFISQLFSVGFAQENTAINDSIYSKNLKEQRSFKVFLPETYDSKSNEKYEVIYLTDGEWAEGPFSFIYKFAQDEDYVPPAIIVTVQNKYIDGANQRDRDFLPVHVPQPSISGGADKFLSFFENELIPYINKKFPVNGTNSLYGHSYGGMFVMYALLVKPELFETYYATDPSFGWNDDFVIKMASEKLELLPPNKLLWIAGITETYKGMGIGRMDSVLQLKAPESLHWKVATFPNEKHNSVRLKAMYDGIKYSYSGYPATSLEFHPMGGILLPDSSINISAPNYPDVRYETDGSEPTRKSKKADSEFSIKAPAQLVVKSFSTSGKYDMVAKADFEIGEVLPSVKKPKKINPGGLSYSYFEGEWEKLPDFEKLKALKKGVADSTFNINDLGKTNFACLFEGFLEVEVDGNYLFAVVSDDGAKLFINKKLIIDNDGVRSSESVKSFVLPLEKGFYPIRLEYFQKNEGQNIQLFYMTPGNENGNVIPLQYLYN